MIISEDRLSKRCRLALDQMEVILDSSKVLIFTPRTGLSLEDQGTLIGAEISALEAQLALQDWDASTDWQSDRVGDVIRYLEQACDIISALQQPKKA